MVRYTGCRLDELVTLHGEPAPFVEVQCAIASLCPYVPCTSVSGMRNSCIDECLADAGVLRAIKHCHPAKLHGRLPWIVLPRSHQPRGGCYDLAGMFRFCTDVHGGWLVVTVVGCVT